MRAGMFSLMPRNDLPSGQVTFLFTDIEGSTKLLDEVGEARYEEALAEHRVLYDGGSCTSPVTAHRRSSRRSMT